MNSEAETFIIGKLRELTARPEKIRGASTEIYYDTHVSGDDLWELISSTAQRFGTDFSSMNIRQFAPSEGVEIIRPLRVKLGGEPYQSLTVGALADAIQRGRW